MDEALKGNQGRAGRRQTQLLSSKVCASVESWQR